MANRLPERGSKAPEPSSGKGEPGQYMRLGLAMMIPGLLLSGPIVGYLIGRGLQKWLGWGNWIVIVMLILGLGAAARETIDNPGHPQDKSSRLKKIIRFLVAAAI
jgi:F0F1-type ATP synthase assembly protein I